MNTLLKKLKRKEQAGSKPRCHLLTHGDRHMIAKQLTSLTESFGTVSDTDNWIPEGFDNLEEAQLHSAPRLLPVEEYGQVLASWWLAHPGNNPVTPNWDIASTCLIDGKKGLLLVEAKAHCSELKPNDSCAASSKNRQRIKSAISEANQALNGVLSGWNLSHEHHYQLGNRFAWSWKLASLGIPVILMYLGFLNAREMGDIFETHDDWKSSVLGYAKGVVPDSVWGSKLSVDGTSIYPIIRSIEYPLEPKID